MPARRTLAALLLLGGAAAPCATAQPPPFRDAVTVERVVLEARVLDRSGAPIPDLGPEDFLLQVDGLLVPLESAEWTREGAVDGAPAAAKSGTLPRPAPSPPAPRLVVLFVQADFHPSRLVGLVRMWPKVSAFLETLRPHELVALTSFDWHLKVHCDFTSDRQAVRAALLPSAIFREPPTPPRRDEPSLAAHLDAAEARQAATPERALALVARALEGIPGAKTVVYLGWGLGRFSRSGVRLPPDYGAAVDSFRRSRTAVMVLDLTDADRHSLEVGLEQVAYDTGGFYARTHLFPDLATRQLAAALAGHYELVFVQPDLPPGRHTVTVRLTRRHGTVLSRPTYTD